MRTVLGTSLIVALAFASAASAQVRFVGNPWGYGSGYRHASTYEEGVQRGFADIVRSAGAKNLMDSEAAINWEQARRAYFDNRVYGTQKYFEMRAVNRQARAEERGPRPTMQDLIRYAEVRKPNRLAPNQLDPLSGEIDWPSALRGPEFLEDRGRLEELFRLQARGEVLDGAQLTEIRFRVTNMESDLKTRIRTLPPQAYTEAKSFLSSLSYESLARAR